MIRRVVVKHYWQEEVDHEFYDLGIYFEEQGVVMQVDENGLVEFYNAKPLEGHKDTVVIEQGLNDLGTDNPQFIIDLIMSSAK